MLTRLTLTLSRKVIDEKCGNGALASLMGHFNEALKYNAGRYLKEYDKPLSDGDWEVAIILHKDSPMHRKIKRWAKKETLSGMAVFNVNEYLASGPGEAVRLSRAWLGPCISEIKESPA